MSSPKKKKNPSPNKPAPIKDAARAFEEMREEIDNLASEHLVGINVDIPRAVSIALGAAPHILALREQVAKELPEHPIRYVDHLKTYALAAWYAHLLALPAANAENPVKKLLAEATPLREALLVAAEALGHRGYLDKDHVAEIRSGQGHIDTANDLVALAALFSQNWTSIENKTAVEWDEIEQASELGPQLLVALGERELPPNKDPKVDPIKVRIRAFSLFTRAYDQCRRAVAYLIWGKQELHEIAPSLYSARSPSRKLTGQGGDEVSRSETGNQPESPEGSTIV